MFGKIEFENFEGLTTMPQKAATAWSAFEASGMCGASYKPIAYVGKQQVKGANHWFIAEQTLSTAIPEKHIVTLAINEFNGMFAVIPTSINRVEFNL